ncbi:SBBP repeat-containing protein [Vallitalea pronyensis]|uniref:SBBP repeat-containing protein n=1 Tax=Vallitalea pronyensis TaxID=1348613 RepID=A0A8J8SHG7_9FIRM|nr:SBBP repeat-containing protein [Vallitalea pronyensis]QUI23830.1 SBBP repeat-containing protein [Vallitalea pronyensis]
MPISMKTDSLKDTIHKSYITIPLTFIPNKGQVDTKAKFYVNGAGYGFYFTPEEAVLSFTSQNTTESNTTINGIALALRFIDSNPDVEIYGLDQAAGKVNYFRGKNESEWMTNLPTYEKIIYKELWKGIDLVFYGKNHTLKYNFVLHPGAAVEDIKLAYKGSKGISLDDRGNLQVHHDLGILIDECPISYQEIHGEIIDIESCFEIIEQENIDDYFRFEVSNYNEDDTLVIDPGLVFSTFLGALVVDAGTNESNKLGIEVDRKGDVYVAGGTVSPTFPITLGAFEENFPSLDTNNTSAYITKLWSDGSGLIYSTFIGGSDIDEARSIAIDSMGNAYVIGETNSPDFPTTLGAFQEDFPGLDDSSAFIAKLNPDGTSLIYSTFLGGSDDDEGTDIAVDNKGNAYVVGETNSSDFPTTQGAFQQKFLSILEDDLPEQNGDIELQQSFSDVVFVAKLNPDGSNLVYSTFLGGSDDDEGHGIAVDHMGNAYVTGETNSPDFPTTLGAFQENFHSATTSADTVFITKLNPDGSKIVYSTFLGGNGDDQANRIVVDKMGNAYVGGETTSSDFPVTRGAFQEDFRADGDAGFVTKLNPDGTALIYSTFLNGNDGDNEVQGIAVDDMGNAYVAGFSDSPDFPVTSGAFQEDYQGAADSETKDVFVAKLNPDGSILLYSTFLGGSEDDIARDIAIDEEGNAYVIGYTNSSNFPITLGAFDVDFKGNNILFDTFVAKITPDATP